ncbi:hypothetical protein [Psychrobacillus sp. FSL H8-0510]|uniref:hypothetical protein n=1 Tax=Psychrobacillus sp. FSL H8-0510 TaxID=2921394 RepID=UPI0030FB8EED
MISRKDRFKSNKSTILVFLDKYINIVTGFWNDQSGWIILSILTIVIFTLPGWLYIIFE